MKRAETGSLFVKHLKIVRLIPCLADPYKVRFTAEFDRDVSEIFPYLNAVLPGAIYNHSARTLTLRKGGSLITLYSRQVVAAKISNARSAEATVRWITDLINECYRKRGTIVPNFERREKLNIIDIVKLLPGTNCKQCGCSTCLAFATLLAEETASILACKDIFLVDYQARRKALLALLKAAGYPLPEAFS